MRAWLAVVTILAGGCRSQEKEPGRTTEPPPPPGTASEPPAVVTPMPPDASGPAPEPATAPPDAPSLPGARLVTSAAVRQFGVGPGSIYWCDHDALRSAPKAGPGGADAPQHGTCSGSFTILCDADSVYYCDDRGLVRVADGGESVLVGPGCLLAAVDEAHVYYLMPGFDDIPDPGVYRVAKTGGQPEKLYSSTPREQYLLALEQDAIWIGTFGAGKIVKLPKAGGKATTVVTGQKHMVDIAVDSGSLYWLAEDTSEVRRRKKRGGPIEVIGRDVAQEPIIVDQGHAFWFEGGAEQAKRLVHLAPGAKEPTEVVGGLDSPLLQVDKDGIYVAQWDRPGIFAFPR